MSEPSGDRGTVGARYRGSRRRTEALLRDLEPEQWSTPVPACPGWRVHDVLGHLVGVIEDAAAGRIQGPPDPSQTADEVDRHRVDDPAELLDRWDALAPMFEDAVSAVEVWPAFLDALSHEHDISGALGGRGPRDAADVALAAELVAPAPTTDRGLVVIIDDRPAGPAERAADGVQLRTSAYELFRLRLGRRTRAQVMALEWSTDPTELLDDLFIFGPAAVPFDD